MLLFLPYFSFQTACSTVYCHLSLSSTSVIFCPLYFNNTLGYRSYHFTSLKAVYSEMYKAQLIPQTQVCYHIYYYCYLLLSLLLLLILLFIYLNNFGIIL